MPSRLLSVIDSLPSDDLRPPEGALQALERWSTADDLAIRLTARDLITRFGMTPPPIERAELPSVYKLVAPAAEAPEGLERPTPLGHDDLEATITASTGVLDELAHRAGVDRGILAARVAATARHLAGEEPLNDTLPAASTSVLGWSYYKPSIVIWQRAAVRAAAELVDAPSIDAATALRLSAGPLYDPGLIARRPVEQPPSVLPAVRSGSDRYMSPEAWIAGLADAEQRLAGRQDGFVIIGEYTDVRYLERDWPSERRWQNLGLADDYELAPRPPELRWPFWIDELDGFAAATDEPALLFHSQDLLAAVCPSRVPAPHLAAASRPPAAEPLNDERPGLSPAVHRSPSPRQRWQVEPVVGLV